MLVDILGTSELMFGYGDVRFLLDFQGWYGHDARRTSRQRGAPSRNGNARRTWWTRGFCSKVTSVYTHLSKLIYCVCSLLYLFRGGRGMPGEMRGRGGGDRGSFRGEKPNKSCYSSFK